VSTRVAPASLLALATALSACSIPFATTPTSDASPVSDGVTLDASMADTTAPDVVDEADAPASDALVSDAPVSVDVLDASTVDVVSPSDAVDARDAADATTSDVTVTPDVADVVDVADVTDVLDARDATTLPDAVMLPDAIVPDAIVRDATTDVLDAGDVTDAGDVLDAGDVALDSPDPMMLPAPRPVSPLSTAAVTTRAVVLRWELPAGVEGAVVSFCADPACAVETASFSVVGNTLTVPTDLTVGVRWWRLRARAGTSVGTRTSPIWNFRVLAGTPMSNRPWGAWPDLNGDGYSDVIVGRLETPAYVLGGAAMLSNASTVRTVVNMSLLFDRDFGRNVANAGDVDGDGYTDVLISGVSERLYFVRTRAPTAAGIPNFLSPTQLSPLGNLPVFAAAGDVNGDGYGDVVAANPVTQSLYVFHGSATGIPTMPTLTYRDTVGLSFGDSLAGAGDFNADGFSDVIVGDSSLHKVTVFFGSATGLNVASTDALPPFTRRYLTLTMVNSVAVAGDVDGDGVCDALVGSTNANYAVLLGRAGLNALTSGSPFAPAPTHNATLVGSGADLNGDGTSDFYLSDVSRNVTVGLTTAMGATLLRFSPRFDPLAIASAGDLNRDGFGDLVLGNNNQGRITLFYGARTSTGFMFVEGPAPGGNFGLSVARVDTPRRAPLRAMTK
jgi:FG-GAP-like repeat/FG-GAP repeat